MAGCSKTEMVEMPDSAVIGFGNAYIGNPIQSRAVSTLTTANIDAFYVYGGHDNSLTNTFDGTKVSKSGGTWSYSPVRYWNAGTTYQFAAYAPEIPDGKGTVGTDNANGRLTFTDYVCDPDNQLDLIYAEQSTTAQAENNSPVSFNFQHLLSMIKFTFKSGFPNDVPVTVSELKVYGMAAQGTYDNRWTPGAQAVAETTPFDEMATTTAENKTDASQATQAASANFVVIPQSGGSVTVSFKAAVSLDASEVKTKEFTTTLVPAWEAGNCYNYVATITEQNMEVESITYDDPTVTEWMEQEIESGIGTMVVVNEAGNLATLLVNANPSQITSLKINGNLNEEDFQYIRENLSALETLDLSGTAMTVFPNKALRFDSPNTTLEEVILPEGLTTIEDAAFANCTALEKLNVPSTVTTLGRWILENTKVASFTIPEGVTTIPASCFYASALTSMVVPKTVTSFATIYEEDYGDCSWAFINCMQLTSLVIEAPVNTIPNDFFSSADYDVNDIIVKTNLTSLVLPDEVETIGAGAFNGCPITNLQLPANLKSIGDEAFAYCEITELILPKGFTTLKGGAFRNAPLKKLDLPSTIEDLNTNSHVWLFNGANLEEVICRDSNPPALSQSYSPFCDVEHFTFVNETCVLKVPAASVDTYNDSDWAKYFKNIEAMTD